ncbi:DUF2254 domain-containing protein [Arthrobacter sp. KK5.5]|uniref:DUF2254 domain-containing protein n=1 Tax=Arthrobacter sp. KK5.5 TaxID=3373084 RepID=UPI003EE511DE
MRGSWLRIRDALRHELWPLPLLAVAVGIVAGVLLPWLDGMLGDPAEPWATLTVGGGADAARSLLTTIATSIMTVTSLTFSLTVVTLQLASSQYTPRMLRTFSSDRVVHWTLAAFLGTFTYAIVVLRTVRSPDTGDEFVPHLAVTFAFVLGLGSIAALVLFLAHLAREIRAENILDQLRKNGIAAIERHYPPAGSGATRKLPDQPKVLIRSHGSGFLTSVELAEVAAVGTELGRTIHFVAQPGEYVLEGTTLAVADGPDLPEEETARLASRVNDSVQLGPERTQLMDTSLALTQLADVAARALSPGTNDPTTAIHAIRHASAVLVRALRRDCGPVSRIDAESGTGATLPLPDFAELLDKTFTPVRTYGQQDPEIVRALAAAVGGIAANDAAHRHGATLLEFLRNLEGSVDAASLIEHDRANALESIARARSLCTDA